MYENPAKVVTLQLLQAFIRPQLRERCLDLVIVFFNRCDSGVITAIDWREEVEPSNELEKRVGLFFPLECLGVYHTATVPPKQSTLLTVKDNAKGKDAKLRMMEGGGISDQLSTDFVSGIRPPNMTFQVTMLLIVSLQLRKRAEYIVFYFLVLNPQVDGLEVQVHRPIIIAGSVPINSDVGFLFIFRTILTRRGIFKFELGAKTR